MNVFVVICRRGVDVEILKEILPGMSAMKVYTALCFILGGVCLWVGQQELKGIFLLVGAALLLAGDRHANQARETEIKKLNRLKEDFLSTVSHELRTPISNIKMATYMLAIAMNKEQHILAELSKAEPQRSKVAEYLKILLEESDRELNLIQDLLDLQHLEAGTYHLDPTPINLRDWIPQVVKPFEIRTQNQQQSLRINLATEISVLTVDLPSLKRILTELVNNACKYAPSGATITITATAKSGRSQLSVINTGVEIPARELPYIFDKFYRIPNGDPWKQGGIGLGLALVKKLVEQMGGLVWVKSAGGQTCFTVEIPTIQI